MKVSWFDSDDDFEKDIMTSIIFNVEDFRGVSDAIDMRKVLHKGKDNCKKEE